MKLASAFMIFRYRPISIFTIDYKTNVAGHWYLLHYLCHMSVKNITHWKDTFPQICTNPINAYCKPIFTQGIDKICKTLKYPYIDKNYKPVYRFIINHTYLHDIIKKSNGKKTS